jgi:hypothetical protein
MKMIDMPVPGGHQTEVEVTHVYGTVAIESRWLDDRDTMVYSLFTRTAAIKLAWAIVKAALNFRRLK